MVLSAQRFGAEAFGRRCIAFSREKEVDRRTGRVDSPVQIDPLALNPDVGLIHPPAVVGRSEPRSQSALNFWGVTLDPPPDGDVVDQKSALGKEFLHIAVGKREAQVSADRKQDDLRFKLAPLEYIVRKPKRLGVASGQPITEYLQSCNTSISRDFFSVAFNLESDISCQLKSGKLLARQTHA